jgi:hypothetical protein
MSSTGVSAALLVALPLGGLAAFAGFAAYAAGCDSGQGPQTGLEEPMIVNGQFIPGALPGIPPVEDDAGQFVSVTVDAGPDGASPPLAVKVLTFNSSEVQPGQASKNLSGSVSNDAVAVGVRMKDYGSGYWVVPTGPVDGTDPTAVTFGMSTGFEPTVPAGLHDLLFVAIGPSGQGGPQSPFQFCFLPSIPDNGHACSPTTQPPATVFSLKWDSNFDLDLHVVTPSGLDINPKEPFGTESIEAGVHGVDPNLPRIDRDSERNCVVDGYRQEDVIFQQPPAAGTYTIYVDPYASCGQAAARFTFTVYKSSGTCPSCTFGPIGSPVSGELIASQVTGGVLSPLKIDQVTAGP